MFGSADERLLSSLRSRSLLAQVDKFRAIGWRLVVAEDIDMTSSLGQDQFLQVLRGYQRRIEPGCPWRCRCGVAPGSEGGPVPPCAGLPAERSGKTDQGAETDGRIPRSHFSFAQTKTVGRCRSEATAARQHNLCQDHADAIYVLCRARASHLLVSFVSQLQSFCSCIDTARLWVV